MEKITSTVELKSAIQLLEVRRTINGQLLKEQFDLTCESLRPLNLLKDITVTTIGMLSGYISKRLFVGKSENWLRKFLGTILQLEITNTITQHPETIKSFGQYIIQHIFHKLLSRKI